MAALQSDRDIQRWNEGHTPILLAHPANAGHGLNLQAGGHTVVWFGLPWSLKLYEQGNGRIHRQGQEQPVAVYQHTIDEDVMNTYKRGICLAVRFMAEAMQPMPKTIGEMHRDLGRIAQ